MKQVSPMQDVRVSLGYLRELVCSLSYPWADSIYQRTVESNRNAKQSNAAPKKRKAKSPTEKGRAAIKRTKEQLTKTKESSK